MAQTDRINKEERQVLMRILKERFGVLRRQLGQREQEMEQLVSEQIMQESDAEIKSVRKELKRLSDRRKQVDIDFSKLVEDARERGLEVGGRADYLADSHRFTVEPINFRTRVGMVMRRLRNEGGAQQLSLHEQELQLQEKLLLSAISSDAAKSFLDEIPTVDKLLPMPDVKAITVAEREAE